MGPDRSPPRLSEIPHRGWARRANGYCRGSFDRPIAHIRDGLPGENELSRLYVNSLHSGQDHIIATAGIDDQDLSKASVRSRKGDPTVVRRRDDRFRPRRHQHALFRTADAVRRTISAHDRAGRREGQQALRIGEGHGRSKAARILERRNNGFLNRRRLGFGEFAGGFGFRGFLRGFFRPGQVLFHLGNQLLHARRLARQVAGPLLFGVERLFGDAERSLPRIDQSCELLALKFEIGVFLRQLGFFGRRPPGGLAEAPRDRSPAPAFPRASAARRRRASSRCESPAACLPARRAGRAAACAPSAATRPALRRSHRGGLRASGGSRLRAP